MGYVRPWLGAEGEQWESRKKDTGSTLTFLVEDSEVGVRWSLIHGERGIFLCQDFLVSQYQHLLGHHGKKLRIISGERRGDIRAIWNSLFFPTTPSGLESKYRMATVSILEWGKKNLGRQ